MTTLLQIADAAGQPAKIEVDITTHLGDQQSFVEGDVVSFLLTLNNDAYVYLFYKDANSNVFLIYPNQQSQNHFYQEGFYMPLPPSKDRFQYKIQPPFGEETLFVFATDNAVLKLPGRILENGLYQIESSIRDIKADIRGQSINGFGVAELRLVSLPL